MGLSKHPGSGIKFSQALICFGFIQSKTDYSLFTKGSGDDFVALLVYVDDIVITSPNSRVINSLKSFLHSQFKLKDLGCFKYFLGIEIACSKSGIVISKDIIHCNYWMMHDI